MNKNAFKSLGILALAGVLYVLHLTVESTSLEIKFGFLSKILLIVGLLSFWLFGVLGTDSKRGKNTN